MSMRNAIVGQSGGPTSAINATLSGVIQGAAHNVGKLYGMSNGIAGLLEKRLVELNYLFDNEEELRKLELTPSVALGSCRYKLPQDMKSEIYPRIFEILEEYNIGYLFYIGGNDSMDTVVKLSAYASVNSIDVKIIGVPKTIDNDLMETDHCPGYGSAAKYVATTVYEIARDISAYNLPSVTVVELMGRDAGWLGCAGAMSKYYFGKGSDLIYLPEMDFSLDSFLGDVQNKLSAQKTVLVSVSEGIPLDGGNHVTDVFGHKYLAGVGRVLENAIREKIGCKVRSVELNLPQRCAGHIVSKTDIEESVCIGKGAVSHALSGQGGKMVAFKRCAGAYGVDIIAVDASLVANKIKHVPREYISYKDKFVTDKCIEYITPLIQGEVDIKYVMGMPNHFDLGERSCIK